MDRVGRYRKVFDEKQNEHIHLNKKSNALMASLNYKSVGIENHLRMLPNFNNITTTNLQHYESVMQPQFQRPSLTLSSRPQQFLKKIELTCIQPMSNSRAYVRIYSSNLIQYFGRFVVSELSQPFLSGHQIGSSLRARMLDWMVEVIESYKFTAKTYFAGVEIMDRYFAQEIMAVPVQKLHIIGVVAMLIASKMEEVYPFRLKTIHEKIVHQKISCVDLVATQTAMFEKLGFNTLTITFFDQIMLQLYTYSIQQDNNPFKDEKILAEMEEYCSYIAKFITYNYEIVTSFNKAILADTVIKTALEVLNINVPKITDNLNNRLGVQECYKLLRNTISNYKKTYKGLNNLFKFSNEIIVNRVDGQFN